jgi:hypothetical protein
MVLSFRSRKGHDASCERKSTAYARTQSSGAWCNTPAPWDNSTLTFLGAALAPPIVAERAGEGREIRSFLVESERERLGCCALESTERPCFSSHSIKSRLSFPSEFGRAASILAPPKAAISAGRGWARFVARSFWLHRTGAPKALEERAKGPFASRRTPRLSARLSLDQARSRRLDMPSKGRRAGGICGPNAGQGSFSRAGGR